MTKCHPRGGKKRHLHRAACGAAAMLVASCAAMAGPRQPMTSAPAAAIAAGTPLWADTEAEPGHALINKLVDIGTLRQAGDAIEAKIFQTLKLGLLLDMQVAHPGVTIPDGSIHTDVVRIVCRPEGPLSYVVATTVTAPGGAIVLHETYDPDRKREAAVARDREMVEYIHGPLGYHPDSRSLACWAAARKCEGQSYSWPPPPNGTPLEYSKRAREMQSEYDSHFVPHCRF